MNAENMIDKRMSLIVLAWPILIEIFLRMLFGNVDTFMLSGYSDYAVAAVGVANQYVQFTILLFQVVASGSSIVIAQHLGAKNFKKAKEIAMVSIGINLLFGLLISIVMLTLSKPILKIMNLEPQVMGFSTEFLTIVGSFSFVLALSSTITAILRSYGFMKMSVLINIFANILNVIGNLIFIRGLFGAPVLGVKGVAISTVTSQSIALILVFIVLLRQIDGINLLKIISIPKKIFWSILKDILKIGGPSAGEILSYNASQLVITRMITTMGTFALASRFYVMNIMYFIMLAGLAIGQATQILVGYNVGANKLEDAYKTCLRSLKIASVIAFCVALVFSILSRQLLGMFTNKEEILSIGSVLLILAIALEPGRAFNVVLGNSLKGAGDAKFPLFMGIASMWGIATLMSYVLGVYFGLGLIGVWIAFASDEWIRGIAMLIRWKSRKWQTKSIVSSKKETEKESQMESEFSLEM